jgi:hypothetical protein
MEALAKRDIRSEAWRRIPDMNSVGEIERKADGGFRRDPRWDIDAILDSNLEPAGNRV